MRKSYILYIVTIISILFIYTNNVSSLSYESNIGVGFTFNPALSVSLSSSDLVIDNLVPGDVADSNNITISVATNAAYGYTLSSTVGDSIHNNSNLTHSNNVNTFSSIAANADLASLDDVEDNNIWGYSFKDNSVVSPAWSNYNGLSSSSSTVLLDNNNTADSTGSVDFKISAKASSNQVSGVYTGTINFIAVSKVAPMSLLDSFIASGAEQLNGYFRMQDMTHDICESVDIEESELQLIDIRDNKTYWVAKLKDGNCWMTQNLDLDLSHEVALTSETSDIDPESYGTTIYTADTGYSRDEETGVVSWLPSTIDENGIQKADTIDMVWNNNNTSATVPGWANDNYRPYSANLGERYRYTNPYSYTEKTYISLDACAKANNNDSYGCQHTHFGNYYNWSTAVASNNTTNAPKNQANSVCPKNWSLPINGAYGALMRAQNIWNGSGSIYADNGFNNLRVAPLYFQLFGNVSGSPFGYYLGRNGYYWSSTLGNANNAYDMSFGNNSIALNNGNFRYYGFSIRCLAR